MSFITQGGQLSGSHIMSEEEPNDPDSNPTQVTRQKECEDISFSFTPQMTGYWAYDYMSFLLKAPQDTTQWQ